MKRIHDIFDEAVSVPNLVQAHKKLKKKNDKSRRKAKRFEAAFCKNILDLHFSLKVGTWRMHEYKHTVRTESGKRREIDYSSDWGDLIVQCALGQTIGKRLLKSLIDDTFAGIPGRGIKRAIRRMFRRVRAIPEDSPLYVYKIDMKKFYQSIDHDCLKAALRKKIKDKRIIGLLDGLIDSYQTGIPLDGLVFDSFFMGIPIGNLMSPILANFYLNPLDREAKRRGLMYYRYNDDIVALSESKAELHSFKDEAHRIAAELKLTIKPNEQIYPIERFGVDVMGYVVQRRRILVRRKTERRFRRNARRFIERPTAHLARSIASQWGWLKVTKSGSSLFRKCVGCSIENFNSKCKEILNNG